ncbi:hypothetical protein [Sinobaca sp. H24]|uniref:hypothetical protein n=1 Tax=Sinobaca sp. H24 TaxID=2923376 RepID=UPI0020794529|nr:hypothetical protein [Sinobaca sp. H24]
MKPTVSMTILFTIMTLCLLLMFKVGGALLQAISMMLVLAAVAGMALLPTRYIFPAALSLILLYGFYLTGWSVFFANAPAQLTLISHHILFSLFTVSVWLFFASFKTLLAEHAALEKQVDELKKYEPSSMLLSISEFESRVELMLTGMKRRGESGYLLHIVLKPQVYATAALQKSMSGVILESIRAQYDMATINQDGSFSVFLQNTDETGVGIVKNRLDENRQKIMAAEEPPYDVYSSYMEEYDFHTSAAQLYRVRKEA